MRRITLALLLTAIAAGVPPARNAANWPDRPIHLIVPFPAGSSSDIVARLVAKRLGERLQQTLVIENRAWRQRLSRHRVRSRTRPPTAIRSVSPIPQR